MPVAKWALLFPARARAPARKGTAPEPFRRFGAKGSVRARHDRESCARSKQDGSCGLPGPPDWPERGLGGRTPSVQFTLRLEFGARAAYFTTASS